MFATGYVDGTVTVWDVATQQPLLTFEVAPEMHDSPTVYSLTDSPAQCRARMTSLRETFTGV